MVANESQLDADGDLFGNACDGDYDQNNACGFADFTIFLTCFGQSVPGTGLPHDPDCTESDQDGNDAVGFADFTLFLGVFGGPPGPSAEVVPTCGDGAVNQPPEECDPPHDTTCPGQCQFDCTCPAPALACQRAIEQGGMLYAEQMLQAIETCTAPGQPSSLEICLASVPVQLELDAVRTQWDTSTAVACATTNVHSDLGYFATCGAEPSTCTFSSGVLDAPGGSNDLLDCLACHIEEDLGNVGQLLFANQSSTGECHSAIGQGGAEVIRTLIQQIDGCLTQPGATSIAACFQPDEVVAAWRAAAESACAGVDPFATIGYPNLCSGFPPIFPSICAEHALPCTFVSMSSLSADGFDNDLLDCLTCRMKEAALSVARQLHGANLCCIGGTCDTVLSRFACQEASGTPVYYRVDALSSNLPIPSVHGIGIGADGSLYVADHSDWIKTG